MARWLNESTPFLVKVAENGEPLNTGTVYLAPDNFHLLISSYGTVMLRDTLAINGHKPSVDALFESVAKSFGSKAIGVLLTGMGKDGAQGLKSIHDLSGHTIAQDSSSCVVYGMPKEAVKLGAVNEILPFDQIGECLKNSVMVKNKL